MVGKKNAATDKNAAFQQADHDDDGGGGDDDDDDGGDDGVLQQYCIESVRGNVDPFEHDDSAFKLFFMKSSQNILFLYFILSLLSILRDSSNFRNELPQPCYILFH